MTLAAMNGGAGGSARSGPYLATQASADLAIKQLQDRYYKSYLDQLKAIQQHPEVSPLSFNCIQLLNELGARTTRQNQTVADASRSANMTSAPHQPLRAATNELQQSEQQPINLAQATCYECPTTRTSTSSIRPTSTPTSAPPPPPTSNNHHLPDTATRISPLRGRPNQFNHQVVTEFARLQNLSAVASALSWSTSSSSSSAAPTPTHSGQLMLAAAVAASQQQQQQQQQQWPSSSGYPRQATRPLVAPLQAPLNPTGPGRRRRGSRKCRKIYGMAQRQLWCTQCKWKKACSRFLYAGSSPAVAVATSVHLGDHLKLLGGGGGGGGAGGGRGGNSNANGSRRAFN